MTYTTHARMSVDAHTFFAVIASNSNCSMVELFDRIAGDYRAGQQQELYRSLGKVPTKAKPLYGRKVRRCGNSSGGSH